MNGLHVLKILVSSLLIVGCYFGISYSIGEKWEKMSSGDFFNRRYHGAIVFEGKIWMLGGFSDATQSDLNDVWCSVNGINWTRVVGHAPWSPRTLCSLVFNNKMWVISSDIWSSSDGVYWVCESTSTPFTGRKGFSAIVHNNKMWVMGGYTSEGKKNDVYSSVNGITWNQETLSAAWAPRYDHSSLSYHNKMWVIAGRSSSGEYLSDVWSSENGVIWTQDVMSANFGSRQGQASVVFNDKMWVLGGEWPPKNDVYCSID
jgi:hypothetical protein